jgi:hypothetical protein
MSVFNLAQKRSFPPSPIHMYAFFQDIFLVCSKGLGIPIVTLLLEGGKDAIRIIKERLKEGISAVIIEGSGRAADIIAYAYRNATKNSAT